MNDLGIVTNNKRRIGTALWQEMKQAAYRGDVPGMELWSIL